MEQKREQFTHNDELLTRESEKQREIQRRTLLQKSESADQQIQDIERKRLVVKVLFFICSGYGSISATDSLTSLCTVYDSSLCESHDMSTTEPNNNTPKISVWSLHDINSTFYLSYHDSNNCQSKIMDLTADC